MCFKIFKIPIQQNQILSPTVVNILQVRVNDTKQINNNLFPLEPLGHGQTCVMLNSKIAKPRSSSAHLVRSDTVMYVLIIGTWKSILTFFQSSCSQHVGIRNLDEDDLTKIYSVLLLSKITHILNDNFLILEATYICTSMYMRQIELLL